MDKNYTKISDVLSRLDRDHDGDVINPQDGRRRPGEVATRRDTDRLFCLECCGWKYKEAQQCTATKCWHYPYREGTFDSDLIEEERKDEE